MPEQVKVPQGYVCPITCDLMVNPVIDPDGNSYEKAAITEWLQSSKLSPITRKPLDVSKLVPNRALQEAIETFKEKNPTYGLPVGLLSAIQKSTSESSSTGSCPSSVVDDALSVQVMRNSENILVSIKASAEREPTTQTSSDICCVVDTSGSMGSDVQIKSASGINESFGINILDLVKHAMKTIVECLTEHDRLSLVDFNSTASVLFGLTVMDAQGKAFARKKIDEMDPGGGTNLYDGLIKGLDILTAEASTNRNSSLFLLTDGMASTEPPKGTIPMLRRYIDEKALGNLSCTINTFGFGYDLDTELLQALAFEGNGAFAFIPDGSFVGTIFINALSNFLSTVAKDVTLSIENTEANMVLNTELTKHCKHEMTSWGVVYRFGSITYGQSKDLLIGYSNPNPSNATNGGPYCECSLTYTKVISNTKAEVKGIPCTATVADADPVNPADLLQFELHRARFNVVNMIYRGIADRKLRHIERLDASLRETADLISAMLERVPPGDIGSASARAREYLKMLGEDVNGQIAMALLTSDSYNKWGKHYLPSIARAHLAQVCNNFKDPGVQLYGGELFDSLRDRLHEVFCALPPPTPSNPRSYGWSRGGGGSSARPLNMASFANSSGACFHENCRVTLCADGDRTMPFTKPVSAVSRGDYVLTEGGVAVQILYVLKTLCTDGVMAGVHFPETGLCLTHYHPMKHGGRWAFPCDLRPEVQGFPCRAVYSFVLADPAAYSVCINETWCATLGHCFTKPSTGIIAERTCKSSFDNRELLCHAYFGDRNKVVADMQAIIAQQNKLVAVVKIDRSLSEHGVAVITADCIVRDANSNMIVSIKPPCVTNNVDKFMVVSDAEDTFKLYESLLPAC